MTDLIRATLEASPLAALFLTIAAGYLIGGIDLKGFALGSGAVLFVGLACGAFAPKSAPPAALGTLGLLLFLYCVGIQYGNEWYRGLTSIAGLKANFAGLCGLAAASVVTLVIYQTGAASLPHALGMFAGSSTSTPALQAILDALHDQDAAVGYSVTYPFGVAGPILCMYIYLAVFKPRLEAPAAQRIEPTEVRVRNAALFGKSLADLERTLPTGVHVVAIRDQQQNRVPTPSTIIAADHVLLLVGTDPAAIEKARTSIGEATSGELAADRTTLDYVRVYASKRSVVGMPLGKAEGSGRLRLQVHPGATGRQRSAARRRSGARVRRQGGRAVQSEQFRRGAQLLRRFHQGRRRFQLHLHRRWRGHGPPGRDGPHPDSRDRAAHHGAGRGPAGRTRARARSGGRPGSCGRSHCRRTSCSETSGSPCSWRK